MDYKEVIEMQLNQFKRILDTKRVKFRDAHYVIFSDYPSYESLRNLLHYVKDKDLGIIITKNLADYIY